MHKTAVDTCKSRAVIPGSDPESRQDNITIPIKPGYVYILASQKNGTLYIGVTADICCRIWQHKTGKKEGFSKKYGVHMLVYFEEYEVVREAIMREKQLKNWKREWKIALIEKENPYWMDLYYKYCEA